jgi:hypothetical protein
VDLVERDHSLGLGERRWAVSDPPQTIAALIQALDAAIARLGEASSFKQRKARNQVVINRGMALYDRLQELRKWLTENMFQITENVYLENKKKYEDGWNALTAAQEYTREYKRIHYEELKPDDRRGTRSSASHDARPAPQGKPLSTSPKTDGGTVLRAEETRTQRALLQ